MKALPYVVILWLFATVFAISLILLDPAPALSGPPAYPAICSPSGCVAY